MPEPALISRGTVSITLLRDHYPDSFYRIRSGLYVTRSFRLLIVSDARLSKAGTTHTVAFADLKRTLSDEKIGVELPPGYMFMETDVCAVIDCLLAKQPDR